jgi:hypothetical protein
VDPVDGASGHDHGAHGDFDSKAHATPRNCGSPTSPA